MSFPGSYDPKLRQDTLQQELEAAQQILLEEEAGKRYHLIHIMLKQPIDS